MGLILDDPSMFPQDHITFVTILRLFMRLCGLNCLSKQWKAPWSPRASSAPAAVHCHRRRPVHGQLDGPPGHPSGPRRRTRLDGRIPRRAARHQVWPRHSRQQARHRRRRHGRRGLARAHRRGPEPDRDQGGRSYAHAVRDLGCFADGRRVCACARALLAPRPVLEAQHVP